jgi:formiminotetrahydrofolate cyclodeaminase
VGASSIQQLLEQTADRHGSYGGGSAAALSCALSAALVEKLAGRKPASGIARRLRLCCTKLIDADAKVFGQFIRAKNRGDQVATRRALRAATDIPSQVEECSKQVLAVARRIRTHVSPRHRVDLRCAEEIAKAAQQSARALVAANRAWSKQFAR